MRRWPGAQRLEITGFPGGDYRLFAIDSEDDPPAFFGRENRYGHRVYGGLLFGFGQ
jgi:hypothetical protein